jgi:hypothetical protein
MDRIIDHPLNGTRDDFGWRYLDIECQLTMPWYTVGCLQWLITQDLKNMSIFEYGCGISSDWWKAQCKKWNGVESDARWSNGGILTSDMEKYIKACLDDVYDIIVIDGIYRNECVEFALQSIKKGGVIIIDNWDQASTDMPIEWWSKANDLLKKYEVSIYKEPSHVDWKTAIFNIT